MAEIAHLSNINFISPIDLLCNTEGCLLSASRNEFIPMAYDKTRFTYAGSDFFMENFIDKFFLGNYFGTHEKLKFMDLFFPKNVIWL